MQGKTASRMSYRDRFMQSTSRGEARAQSSTHEREMSDSVRTVEEFDRKAPGPRANKTSAEKKMRPVNRERLAVYRQRIQAGGTAPGLSAKAESELVRQRRELSLVESNINLSGDCQSIYVSSCFPGEGKTTAALSMAYGLSVFNGRNVLLVDANFEAPRMSGFFNLTSAQGFSQYLAGNQSLDHLICPTKYSQLYVLPAGMTHAGQQVSWDRNHMAHFLDRVASEFDFIVFDGMSMTKSSEPIVMASVIDKVILVAACGSTKWDIMQGMIDKIFGAGGTMGGVVLNKRKFYIPSIFYRLLANR